MTSDSARASGPQRQKVVLLTNQISPYRVRVYERLAQHVKLTIVHGRMEANRGWSQGVVAGAECRPVAGWTIPYIKRGKREARDQGFFHVEPGYFAELLRIRPDAIVSAEIGFRTAMALLYGAVFQVPVWVWWGGTLHTEHEIGILRRAVRRLAARGVLHWISYGCSSTEYLQHLGVPRSRIVQIQNCVDETMFSKAAVAEDRPDPEPLVLHVGRLIARKGVLGFLEAVARCQRRGLKFSTWLVGSGPDEAKLQARAQQLEVRDVTFIPAQSAESMGSFYRSAQVLAFPTLADVWGLVANEAILCGVPVICSKFAGCAQELFDADAIFDPLDDADFDRKLAAAIRGEVRPVPPTRLWSSYQVADTIAWALYSSTAMGAKQIALHG